MNKPLETSDSAVNTADIILFVYKIWDHFNARFPEGELKECFAFSLETLDSGSTTTGKGTRTEGKSFKVGLGYNINKYICSRIHLFNVFDLDSIFFFLLFTEITLLILKHFIIMYKVFIN